MGTVLYFCTVVLCVLACTLAGCAAAIVDGNRFATLEIFMPIEGNDGQLTTSSDLSGLQTVPGSPEDDSDAVEPSPVPVLQKMQKSPRRPSFETNSHPLPPK